MIKAITFDLDDTLWDIWPVVERAESLLHDWLRMRYPRIVESFTALELRTLCDEIAATQPAIAHDRTQLRKEALQLAATRSGYAAFDTEAAFSVFYIARNTVELFADVRPVLERLTQRYALASLSNGNADVAMIGLSHLFRFSLNAIEAGAAKPHPAMFQQACQLLAVRPEQVVHVGDDPDYDVHAAANVGMWTVWLNRSGRQWPGGLPPHAEIQNLAELEAVLTAWETQYPEEPSTHRQ